MLNLREQIRIILMREGKSMARTLREMEEQGYKVPFPNNMSTRLKNQTIKFKDAQELLDFLGYEINISKKLN